SIRRSGSRRRSTSPGGRPLAGSASADIPAAPTDWRLPKRRFEFRSPPATFLPMILTLILLASIGVILLAERSAEHLPFAIATLIHGTGPSAPLDVRVFLFSVTLVCVAIAFRLSGGGIAFQRIKAQRRCFYSTFMASLIDPHSWRQASGLALSDIANDPLPLM